MCAAGAARSRAASSGFAMTSSPSIISFGDVNLNLTVQFNGAQPDKQIVEKIKAAAVDAMATALGFGRQMQVGM